MWMQDKEVGLYFDGPNEEVIVGCMKHLQLSYPKKYGEL